MDSVMKELMGAMPPRIFGLEPPLFSSCISSLSILSFSLSLTHRRHTTTFFSFHPPFVDVDNCYMLAHNYSKIKQAKRQLPKYALCRLYGIICCSDSQESLFVLVARFSPARPAVAFHSTSSRGGFHARCLRLRAHLLTSADTAMTTPISTSNCSTVLCSFALRLYVCIFLFV